MSLDVTVAPRSAAHAVTVIVKGKDERFWAGLYGSKVTDIALRVLHGGDDNNNNQQQQHVDRQGGGAEQQQRRPVQRPERTHVDQQQEPAVNPQVDWKKMLWELWPFLAVLLAFLWNHY